MNFTLIIQYFFYYQFLLFSLFYTIDYTKDLFLILKMISSSLIIDFIYAGILYILFKDNYKLKKINYNLEYFFIITHKLDWGEEDGRISFTKKI